MYKATLKLSPEKIRKTIQEKKLKEQIQEIKNMKNQDDLLKFIKNMYIEEYNKIVREANLTEDPTTENIQIWEKTQDRVYLDEDTGVIITHGDSPSITEQKLIDHGVNYSDEIEDVKVYKIMIDGKVVDCATLVDGKMRETIIGEDLFTDKQYVSILTTKRFETMIPLVFKYIYFSNRDDKQGIENSKNAMVKAVEELEKSEENQKIATKKDDGFEHE